RTAGHVLHGEVQGAPVRALVVDGDHVRVGQPGDRPGLGDEAPDEVLVVRQLRMHDLQRDRAVEPGVGAQVDGCHPATREMGLHPVPAIEALGDGHAGQGRIHYDESRADTWFRPWNSTKATRRPQPVTVGSGPWPAVRGAGGAPTLGAYASRTGGDRRGGPGRPADR